MNHHALHQILYHHRNLLGLLSCIHLYHLMNILHVMHRMMNLRKNIHHDHLRMKMIHLTNSHLVMGLKSKKKIAELMHTKNHFVMIRMKFVNFRMMFVVLKMNMKILLMHHLVRHRMMMSLQMYMLIQMNIHHVSYLMSNHLVNLKDDFPDHLNTKKNPLVMDLMNMKTKNLMILVSYFL